MNRLAIFNLLAVFCISLAPAQAGTEKRKIKKATLIDEADVKNSRTFDKGNVYLVKTIYDDNDLNMAFYKVMDNSGASKEFLILPSNTIVTKEEILILESIILTVDEGTSTFAFYRKLFSLKDFHFPHKFPATGIFQGMQKWDVTFIRAKSGANRAEWVFVVLNGDTPFIVFPKGRVKSILYQNSNKEMTISLNANREIPITIEFKDSTDAFNFHKFLQEA